MYLGFNYDLARGKQDELLRWAEDQRQSKRVRFARSEELKSSRAQRGELARPEVAGSAGSARPLAEGTGFEDLRAS